PLTVNFIDTSIDSITNRIWIFGDGSITNTIETNTVHTYTVAGTNTVSLIVSGPGGTSTNTQLNYIVVTNIPPILSSSPASRDYGAVPIGQSSNLTFSVINLGQVTLSGTASTMAPFVVSSNGNY